MARTDEKIDPPHSPNEEMEYMNETKKMFNSPAGSFMGVAQTNSLENLNAKACLIGIPFDCGEHPTRIGARQGPDAIRQQSTLIRRFRADFTEHDPLEKLHFVDLGNVNCTPGNTKLSYPVIENAIEYVLSSGVTPITMGGDGAVTLPQLRAVCRHYPDLVVLHFDSHTDAMPHAGFDNATTFTRAAEEQLVNVGCSFHVGVRGNSFLPGPWRNASDLGYGVVSSDQLTQKGFKEILSDIGEKIAGRPVYLCFDMDIFDPSCAPGVCTPEWGGLSAREGLSLIKGLNQLNIVAYDVNTVSPPHDIGGMTAFLAAAVVYECCALAASN